MAKFKVSIHKTREDAVAALIRWSDVFPEEDMEIEFETSGLYALYIPAGE